MRRELQEEFRSTSPCSSLGTCNMLANSLIKMIISGATLAIFEFLFVAPEIGTKHMVLYLALIDSF